MTTEAQEEGQADARQAGAEAPIGALQPETRLPCTSADMQTMDTMYGHIDVVPETQDDL